MNVPPATSGPVMPLVPSALTPALREILPERVAAPAVEADTIVLSQPSIPMPTGNPSAAGNPGYPWLTALRVQVQSIFLGSVAGSDIQPKGQPAANVSLPQPPAAIQSAGAHIPVPSVSAVPAVAATEAASLPAIAVGQSPPAANPESIRVSPDGPRSAPALPLSPADGVAERLGLAEAGRPTERHDPSLPAAAANGDDSLEGLPAQLSDTGKSASGADSAPPGPHLPTADLSLPAHILQDLSRSDSAKLADILEPPYPPEFGRRIEALFRAAVTAAAAGEVDRAIDKIAELIATSPPHAETLSTEPGLQPIGPGVDALVHRLTLAARLTASDRLTEAHALLQNEGPRQLPGWDSSAGKLLHLAQQFLDGGNYANYLRSATLSQLVMYNDRWIPCYPPVAALAEPHETEEAAPEEFVQPAMGRVKRLCLAVSELRQAFSARVRWLWLRAPLLVLLLGWLVVGVVAGGAWAVFGRTTALASFTRLAATGFEVWGLGFLALVGFGFYMRVRHIQFGQRPD